jgi:hypothetical protein
VPTEAPVKMTINDLMGVVVGIVKDTGDIPSAEIEATIVAENAEIEPVQVQRAIVKADRAGLITRQNQDSGWQITAKGEDAEKQFSVKRVPYLLVPYAFPRTYLVTYKLVSASLGCLTEPGGVGQSRLLRNPETGEIVLLGAWLRKAFEKAFDRLDTIVQTPIGLRMIPNQAIWQHITVFRSTLPKETKVVIRPRRPTNTRGMPIGEIIHEALPEGTVFTVKVSFPGSHISDQMARDLIDMAGEVGFSAAGSGKGGLWGVSEVISVEVVNGNGKRAAA